jgi:protoheme ferro-lyase
MRKKTGILLIQLGTPKAPTVSKVRPFLREFLNDPRVKGTLTTALGCPISTRTRASMRP